ncbi:hypothetical protein AYO21_03200 [Fonsecaea monophora]|uniref:FAD/NAD(P)-binding domain-containing protein n=1 Tax=Fonsecaea monophora TaxID=254056 RepID=A0A177FEC6_9EURO|nr:hypothetical protein AYO21_03200 [Fonsecaea monophora]KAH0841822.1 Cyclopentanone 1,2-monooxygenase [Fonsecaea pedrosoi]OAG42615.1 hypothetical protein AYO21_03200 [Fonsecaea monophora]
MAQNGVKEYDAIIVGGGFGGCYLLRNLRKLGYNVKLFEEGEGLGGVWWHNSYPGARVDTSAPFYEFSDPELWSDWNWEEAFPGQKELTEYFKYVDKKWDLSKDILFGTRVTGAEWNEKERKWLVHTNNDTQAVTRFLLLATGFAAKIYVPPLKGLETFQGIACHTARWPKGGIDFRGKRVGVIGTGASGVQVIQEIGRVTKELTVFQRTPNYSMPMGQQKLNVELQMAKKKGYGDLFKLMKQTYAGWDYNPDPRKGLEDDEAERLRFWESLWKKGGFNPWLGNYSDLMGNEEVNTLMYNFWRDKVRARITKDDPELKENLAPEKPPHPFGTKRPSLEQDYYEVYNLPHVNLVPLKKNPIEEITPTGLRTADGKEYDLDILVLATGFDAVTGSFTRIDIKGTDGLSLKDDWANGSRTFLGMATSGFPNMLFMYGPQSPTAFAIGPTISEIQGDWIIKTLEAMKQNKQTRIDATRDAEDKWGKTTNDDANLTLIPKNETSWYMGGNIPGKPRESLNYVAGLPSYRKAIDGCIENGFEGFVFS